MYGGRRVEPRHAYRPSRSRLNGGALCAVRAARPEVNVVKELAVDGQPESPTDRQPDRTVRPRFSAPTAAAALLRTLAGLGVRVAFGIPGGAASPIFDALVDMPEIAFVATRHEAMAGFAASGYGRATGLPALVLTTSGPGLTNAITGMAAATLEELPVIFL